MTGCVFYATISERNILIPRKNYLYFLGFSGIIPNFALEKKYISANPYMLEIVKLLLQRNKRIVICSDMYLSADQIKELLRKVGYPEFDRYLISCENGCSKSDGGLYKVLRAELKDGDKLLHIGDNLYSDLKKARESGVETWYYQPPYVAGRNYRPVDMSHMIGSMYTGIINNTIYNGISLMKTEYLVIGGLSVAALTLICVTLLGRIEKKFLAKEAI